MKKEVKKGRAAHLIIVFSFLIIIYAFAAVALLDRDPTESLFEGRPLAGKPQITLTELFSGEYTRKLEVYFNDTFPLRQELLKTNRRMNTFYTLPLLRKPYYLTPDGATLLYGKSAMELFNYNAEAIDVYCSVLEQYQQALDGVKVSLLLAPTVSAFNRPPQLSDPKYDQRRAVDEVGERLTDAGIGFARVYDTLSARCSAGEYAYFRTDHHWTALGSYTAYREFVGSSNAAPLEGMERYTLPGFVGSMHSFTSQIPQNGILQENPDEIVYYRQPLPTTVEAYADGAMADPVSLKLIYTPEESDSRFKYNVFLGGDHALAKIESPEAPDRSILIVKDSYANAFIPYLVNNYRLIYVVDPRYFGGDKPSFSVVDFVREHPVDEVLFLNYTMSLRNTDWSALLKGIM